MFLVTTADRRFWKEDEKILFLGEWCKLFTDRHIWATLDSNTLSYHWGDAERFARDTKYLNRVYEEYLALFVNLLNEVHGTSYSARYWGILIGMWLRNFINALFDRYLSIKAAADSGLVTNTWIDSTRRTPPEDIVSLGFDDYNFYLYSRIIEFLGTIPYEHKRQQESALVGPQPMPKQRDGLPPLQASGISRHFQKGARVFLRQAKAILLAKLGHRVLRALSPDLIFAGTTYLSRLDQLRFSLSLGQPPFVYQGEKVNLGYLAPNQDIRQSLRLPSSDDEFRLLLNELLLEQLPMVYLEYYKDYHRKVLARGPYAPKAILTAFAMTYRRSFDFWAAYHAEVNQTRILLSQHGGGYGSMRHSSTEKHFLDMCDQYYTWGSTLDHAPKVKPMPSFRLRATSKSLKGPQPDGKILWVGATAARFRICADTNMGGPGVLTYIDDQCRFFSSLSASARKLFVWRYFADLWNEPQRLKARFPDLKIEKGNKIQLGKKSDFIHSLEGARLAVHTTNETTYLETLAANYPTIVFWNPSIYLVPESLLPCFDLLCSVGILHYSPESAAQQVNEVFDNPLVWWQAPATQEARQSFCKQLALTSKNWLAEWKAELSKHVTNYNPVRIGKHVQ